MKIDTQLLNSVQKDDLEALGIGAGILGTGGGGHPRVGKLRLLTLLEDDEYPDAVDIVQPTDLGTVASVNESSSVTADWRSYQNFTSGERYTTVEFTLPAASSVEFAPSKARVVTLSWATSAQDSAEGIFSTVTGLFGDDEDLSQRTYDIDGRQGNRKTVPLTSANTSQRVSEWFAEYQTSEGDWAPVDQDPEAPVYYTQPNRDEVRLHYNTNTTVRFTANPTLTESVSYRWTSYTAGWDGLGSLVDNLSF